MCFTHPAPLPIRVPDGRTFITPQNQISESFPHSRNHAYRTPSFRQSVPKTIAHTRPNTPHVLPCTLPGILLPTSSGHSHLLLSVTTFSLRKPPPLHSLCKSGESVLYNSVGHCTAVEKRISRRQPHNDTILQQPV